VAYNTASAQTYDTITKQKEIFKNNPQMMLGAPIPTRSSVGHDIEVNPTTNEIYTSNLDLNTVSVINSNTGNVTTVRVGISPQSIAINQYTNKIYVTNSGSNTVSVIDGYNNNKISDIRVGYDPTVISINSPDKNIIYVVNSGSNTVSIIDGSIDKVTAGVTFNVYPANSGAIWCNNKEYPTNTYLYVASGSKCIAKPNKDFEFSSWAENIPGHNSTIPLNQSAISDSLFYSLLGALGMKPNDTSATFNVNRYGTFTANFKPVPPSVPPQYWSLIITVIVTTIVGWSIPSIIGWMRARTKRKESIKEYDNIIESLSNAIDLKSLDRINNQVIRAYISERINEFQYKVLDKKISDYYNILYKRNNATADQREYKRSPI
jgi:YVTN family beta-propeller protein